MCDAADASYFAGATVAVIKKTNYSYVRKDTAVNIECDMDTAVMANYVVYTNDAHENKLFCAFITKHEYVNDRVTKLYLETDVYQTWHGVMTLEPCFTVREHTTTDNIGDHTLPEGLETGPFTKISTTKATDLNTLAVIVGVTQHADGSEARGRVYGGIYSALLYFAFFGSTMVGGIETFVQSYVTGGVVEAVRIMFTYPSALLPSGLSSGDDITSDFLSSPVLTKAVTYIQSTVGGYSPKNKKLFCYPYNFLHVSNLQGQAADFKFELLHTNAGTFNFSMFGACSPGAKVGCYPSGYRNNVSIGLNYEEGLTLQNYPLCSWQFTPWENWIAQNAVNVASTVGAGVIGTAAGIATANPLMITGGIAAVMSQVQQIARQTAEPEQSRGNTNGSTLAISGGVQTFEFAQMQITAEYARVIDEFFSMFGYKVNRVKVPNTTNRDVWNYVLTNDCIITGAIPFDDKQRLQRVFNDGVTIWHTNDIGDYTAANGA